MNMLLRMCLRAPGMLIGALIMALQINARLAIILAIVMPIMTVTMGFVLKTGFPRFGIMQKKIDGLNNTLQENLVAIRVVKAFVREDHERKKFNAANEDLMNAGLNVGLRVITIMPIMVLSMST